LLTAREVAELLGLAPGTITKWVRDGKLPAFRCSTRAIRFREAEIERWLEQRATTERGVVTHPAGRRPAGNLAPVTHPDHEED
jgi:excisionase family DNA binding protein